MTVSGPRLSARRFLSAVRVLVAAGIAPAVAQAPQDGVAALDVLHVRGPIYMIGGDGGNVTVSVGPDGALLVDTGSGAMTEQVLAAVRGLQREESRRERVSAPVGGAETRSAAQFLRSPPPPLQPVRYVMNTSADPEHTGGNADIGKAPREMSFQSPLELATRRLAYENVLLRMSGAMGDDEPLPYEAWPSDTYVSQYYKLSSYVNGDAIELVHVPAAYTDGDSFVWFRHSDVISAGDIYMTTGYPIPDLERGGSIQGIIDGLNELVELAQPEYRDEGGTMIVPGHGRLSDFGDLLNYRDAITIVRDRIQHMIDAGMTLRQIEAARPSLDYDPRYGTEKRSSVRFIEAVYRSLTRDE